MLTRWKPSLSHRWLAIFLLAAALPAVVFVLWGTKRINVLVDEALQQTLASDTHLLQALINQQQGYQLESAEDALKTLSIVHDFPRKIALLEVMSPNRKVSILSAQDPARSSASCYFEKSSGSAPLQSVCVVSDNGFRLITHRSFTVSGLLPSTGTTRLKLRFLPEKSSVESLSFPDVFREHSNGVPYLSKALPLRGSTGKPVAFLIVSEPQELLASIRERRIKVLWLILLGVFLFILVLARRFRTEVLTPIQAVTDAAQRVSDGCLDWRIPEMARYAPLRNTIRQFNQMLDQLVEKQQLQDHFIANLTHDLRTPLVAQERAFELFNEEFKQSGLPHLEELSNGLLKNNRHLLSMINLLLETYRFDAGKLQLHFQPIRIAALLEDCVLQLRPLSDEKNITVRFSPEGELPSLLGDIDALRRVLLNLIGNAIENIPRQSEIDLRVCPDNGRLCIVIRDNGPGLPSEEMNRLFERFQGHSSRKRKLGSGLGLYICRMLIEAHSGSITVDSRPGQYTSFEICLPIERNG